MTRRKKTKPVEADVPDPHEEIAFHAALFVERLIPEHMAHFNLCASCFGREIIQQLQEALACAESHEAPDDEIGEPRGSA